jgi:hypothetical protein
MYLQTVTSWLSIRVHLCLCIRANQKFNSPLTKADVHIQASPSRALEGDNHKIAFMAITHFLDEVSVGIAPMPKMSTF